VVAMSEGAEGEVAVDLPGRLVGGGRGEAAGLEGCLAPAVHFSPGGGARWGNGDRSASS
jgi:hypothetical protein